MCGTLFFVHFCAVVLHDYNVKRLETSWLHFLWRKCRTCSCSLFTAAYLSSLATASARQCNTCYGRDGTIASRSIDTERGSAAFVLTRKQKATARPSGSFQQGGPGFRILLTFTLFVQPLAQVLVSTGPISLK